MEKRTRKAKKVIQDIQMQSNIEEQESHMCSNPANKSSNAQDVEHGSQIQNEADSSDSQENSLARSGEYTIEQEQQADEVIVQQSYTKNMTEVTKEKAKEYAHEGFSMLRQFLQLLFSFITALFPNITDIFTWQVFKRLCIMVRIEHTVFALPFAYIGLLIASRGSTNVIAFILITIAMFGIRSFAMTINRIADITFDSMNPRTQNRELVTGEITMGQAKAFAFVSLCIFVVSCALINTTVFALSPIPIIFSILYSYMKRITWYCHFILGGILALAPIAGQLAILGSISGEVITLSFGILFWVAGFDILYACQDTDFDKEHNLYSIPACFGIPTALLIAKLCHVNTILFFFLFGILAGLNIIWYFVWIAIAGLLLWEHSMLSPYDLSKINHAFFTINACVSIAVLVGV